VGDCDWIEFIESRPRNRKTRLAEVRAKQHGILLGYVKWYSPWRQYAFYPEASTVWTPECMEAVADYIESLMTDRRTGAA